MIHPINIPEELFATNPRRPKLLISNDKPRKKLSYTNDGRKMVDDVIKSPLSPNSIWRETFLRTFIRRLSLSKINPTQKSYDKQRIDTHLKEDDTISRTSIPIETCDMIDIVDLEPKNNCKSRCDQNNVTTVVLEDEEILKNCCPVDYNAICPILKDCCQNIVDTNGDRIPQLTKKVKEYQTTIMRVEKILLTSYHRLLEIVSGWRGTPAHAFMIPR